MADSALDVFRHAVMIREMYEFNFILEQIGQYLASIMDLLDQICDASPGEMVPVEVVGDRSDYLNAPDAYCKKKRSFPVRERESLLGVRRSTPLMRPTLILAMHVRWLSVISCRFVTCGAHRDGCSIASVDTTFATVH